MVAFLYLPAVTVVFERAIVPEVVMGPPVSPVPVLTVVTVPVADVAGSVLVMVKLPFDPETAIPGPAFSEMTPVLVTVTMPPTLADTKMPEPGKMLVIPPPPLPPALMVPVMLLMYRPEPTTTGPRAP
jgi:hypothetical protein